MLFEWIRSLWQEYLGCSSGLREFLVARQGHAAGAGPPALACSPSESGCPRRPEPEKEGEGYGGVWEREKKKHWRENAAEHDREYPARFNGCRRVSNEASHGEASGGPSGDQRRLRGAPRGTELQAEVLPSRWGWATEPKSMVKFKHPQYRWQAAGDIR